MDESFDERPHRRVFARRHAKISDESIRTALSGQTRSVRPPIWGMNGRNRANSVPGVAWNAVIGTKDRPLEREDLEGARQRGGRGGALAKEAAVWQPAQPVSGVPAQRWSLPRTSWYGLERRGRGRSRERTRSYRTAPAPRASPGPPPSPGRCSPRPLAYEPSLVSRTAASSQLHLPKCPFPSGRVKQCVRGHPACANAAAHVRALALSVIPESRRHDKMVAGMSASPTPAVPVCGACNRRPHDLP